MHLSLLSYDTGKRLAKIVAKCDAIKHQLQEGLLSTQSTLNENMARRVKVITKEELQRLSNLREQLDEMETDLREKIKIAKIQMMPMRDLIQSGATGELITNKLETEDD